MENLGKIVTPTIQRCKSDSKNDLYDLIHVIPAEYKIASDLTKNNDCDFIPRTGKYYIPKKRSKLKVKTVRDIRKVFEEDTYSYLSNELERQQSILLRKIRCGSACNEDTKALAKKILNADTPISRSAWQMLVNINPDLHIHPKQYVLWNDRYIQINGSKGGRDKLLFKYNLAQNKINLHKKINLYKKSMMKRKGLLRNSLAIKFKPGPLRRKKNLDVSHQKYHVGDIELINLPKPGLDILPAIGTALEPTITCFLNNLRNDDGIISQKWAEMAVSVLSTVKKSGCSETSEEYISFDLGYKFDQHRILMRRDVESFKCSKKDNAISQQINLVKNESLVLPEVEDIMSKILDSVEISINQDNMFTTEDEIIDDHMDDVKQENMLTKDTKVKRKFCELGRLDVTVIRLPRESQNTCKENCNKLFCTLGCICDSLAGTVNFKRHCGRLDCMFKCKCDFSKYRNIHSGDMDYDLLPGLVHFDTEMNLKLSKEEQKFHQTVIVTDEKSILLKAQKRNSKVPKKYAEFYDSASMKQKGPRVKPLSIVAVKIDCQNVEPWCMVHNLYKCFCKGMFTQSCKPTSNECVEDCVITNTQSSTLNSLSSSFENNDPATFPNDLSTCSRVNMYLGRKFNDVYYKETNDKIQRMEENDNTLSKKLEKIINKTNAKYAAIDHKSDEKYLDSEEIVCNDKPLANAITSTTKDTNKMKTYSRKIVPIHDAKPKSTKYIENSANINQIMTGIDEVLTQTKDSGLNLRSKSRRLPNKTKLVAWLETNYKMFKERIDRGLTKIYLEPPKVGKVALYPWHFILDRYRERKNLFLISKSKPYRIFMAVHSNIPTLENCVNINDIRFAELHNYPVTIKNLLTNATDLKDNFCILCGLTGCWEVIGSVTKVNEADSTSLDPTPSNIENTNCFHLNATWADGPGFEDDIIDSVHHNTSESDGHKLKTADTKYIEKSPQVVFDDSSPILYKDIDHGREDCNMSNDTSKWFVMTVENDFSEIRFYKKGFFVKYESIVKAINVARISAKSVRLSSQKCVDKNNGPQFGIYAIPNANEYCVFVGPYDIEESLGIETIKTIMDVRKAKRTRGFWITTSKVDNMRVIDNPLSFMPFNTYDAKETVTLDNEFCSSDEQDTVNQSKFKDNESVELNKTTSKNTKQKIVKPIKIRKTNGFYHLSSNGLLKKITSPNASPSNSVIKSLLLDKNKTMFAKVNENLKQDAPQELSPIKITSVYSVKDGSSDINVNVPEKGMFILKPEEINKKIYSDESSPEKKSPLNSVLSNLKNALSSEKNRYLAENHAKTSLIKEESLLKKNSTKPDSIIEIDTNKNLKDQIIAQTSCNEVCIISDEEDEIEDEEKRSQKRRRLWMDSFKSDLISKEENRNFTKAPNKALLSLLSSTSAQGPSKSKKKNNPEQTSLATNPDSSSSPLPEAQLPWNQVDAQSSNILSSLANAPDNVKRSMTEALSNIMSLVKDLNDH